MQVPEHDESTYYGRFESFRAAVNPFNVYTSNGDIKRMQKLLADQRAREDAQLAATGSSLVQMSAE